jgi:uncharacterized damage-inducible protein DinB
MPGNVRPVTDERDGLLAYLAHQRDLMRVAAYGLTDEQARLTPTASTLSVGGLVKHVAFVERNWIDIVLQRPGGQSVAAYAENFRLGENETLASVLARYDEAAKETESVIASIPDLNTPVPKPTDVPWFPQEVTAWSVRWVLLHLIQETARHAGHADIIRESIDGATAIPLMAGLEGWPETDWVKPWRPPVAPD